MSLFIGDKRVTFAQIGGTPIIPSTTFQMYLLSNSGIYNLNTDTGVADNKDDIPFTGRTLAYGDNKFFTSYNISGRSQLYRLLPVSLEGNLTLADVRVGSSNMDERFVTGMAHDATPVAKFKEVNPTLEPVPRLVGVATAIYIVPL